MNNNQQQGNETSNQQQGNSGGIKFGKGFKQAGSSQTNNSNYQQTAEHQSHQTNMYGQGANYNTQQSPNAGNNYSNNQGNTYSNTVSNTAELPNEKDTRNICEKVKIKKTKRGKGFKIAGTFFILMGILDTVITLFHGKVDISTLISCVCCCLIGAMFYFFGWLKIKAGKGFVIAGVSIIVFWCCGIMNNISYGKTDGMKWQIIAAILLCIPGAVLIFVGYLNAKTAENNVNIKNTNNVQNASNMQFFQDNQSVQTNTNTNGFCSKCGKPLNGDPFCSNCGSPVNK